LMIPLNNGSLILSDNEIQYGSQLTLNTFPSCLVDNDFPWGAKYIDRNGS